MDRNVLVFSTLSAFLAELRDVVGKEYKPLLLFNRFVMNVNATSVKTIEELSEAFLKFLSSNHDAVIAMDETLLAHPVLYYSKKLCLDFSIIFPLLDADTKTNTWKYLLKLYAILSPGCGAKDKLRELVASDLMLKSTAPLGDNNFLSNIYGSIESKIRDYDTEDPFVAVGQMMTDGVFSDILNQMKEGISSGNVNVEDLLSGVTSTLANSGMSDLLKRGT